MLANGAKVTELEADEDIQRELEELIRASEEKEGRKVNVEKGDAKVSVQVPPAIAASVAGHDLQLPEVPVGIIESGRPEINAEENREAPMRNPYESSPLLA